MKSRGWGNFGIAWQAAEPHLRGTAGWGLTLPVRSRTLEKIPVPGAAPRIGSSGTLQGHSVRNLSRPSITEHRKAASGVTVRNGILWGLRSLGVIVCVLAVSCGLWWGLAALGDHGGSAGARGVAYVALACLVIDIIGLVVLLSICRLQGEIASPTTLPPEPPSSGSVDAD